MTHSKNTVSNESDSEAAGPDSKAEEDPRTLRASGVLHILVLAVSVDSCPDFCQLYWDALRCLQRAVEVSLESALNFVSRRSPFSTCSTHFAVLGVKITSSICYDRADNLGIRRGTYYILESTQSTTRSPPLSKAIYKEQCMSTHSLYTSLKEMSCRRTRLRRMREVSFVRM